MNMVDSNMDYFSCKRRRISVDEDEDGLEEYFATYVPLSNLPTPPLSSASSPSSVGEAESAEWGVSSQAQQLSRLVPQKASRHPPSPALISTYLARAQLSETTVALAACILDSLSSQFVRAWQRECETVKRRQESGWSVHPSFMKSELVVMGALAVASSFLDDVRREPRWWANSIACGAVEVREVDATIRCIFKDLDYDLCGFTAEEVEGMRRELYGTEWAAGVHKAKQLNALRQDWDCLRGVTGLLTPERTPPPVGWAIRRSGLPFVL